MAAPQHPAVQPGTGSIHSREATGAGPHPTRTIETQHGEALVYWDDQDPADPGFVLRFAQPQPSWLDDSWSLSAGDLDGAERQARDYLTEKGLL